MSGERARDREGKSSAGCRTGARLRRSAACRSWYRWRRLAQHTPPPLWVTLSPPWPVVRLAYRIKGRSPLLAALSMPFALLASIDDDQSDTVSFRPEPRAKSHSRWARRVDTIGAGS
ncbi:MAG: hypothetical protein OEU92_14395 [Alphaproteobacteria bacterium]|nr:hypothetical protein [Alphaproteobacteria bacterium]